MKIPEIKTQIIKNFTDLHKLAYSIPRAERTVPLWKVGMGNWHVSQGVLKEGIWYKKGLIRVLMDSKENNVEIMKKPFFMWEKWVLKRVNRALVRIMDNYYNYDVVKKIHVPVRVYTKEAIEELEKASEK